MSETADTDTGTGFSAQAAVRTLSDLENHEDALNARAGALSWTFFGMGGAAIFVTYEAATPTFTELGVPWLLAFLWMPWILGASFMLNNLWKMLAVTTRIEHDSKTSWAASLLGTLGFFAIAGLLWLIARMFDLTVALDGSVGWTLVVGVFTAALARYQARRFGAPDLGKGFVSAGAVIFLVGAAMATWPLPGTLPGLVGAAATLLAYFGAASYVYRRG